MCNSVSLTAFGSGNHHRVAVARVLDSESGTAGTDRFIILYRKDLPQLRKGAAKSRSQFCESRPRVFFQEI